jgi:hypothetical protein
MQRKTFPAVERRPADFELFGYLPIWNLVCRNRSTLIERREGLVTTRESVVICHFLLSESIRRTVRAVSGCVRAIQ